MPQARFSLRAKVLSIFLLSVLCILLLSDYLYYLSSSSILIQSAKNENEILAKEMTSQIATSEQGELFIDDLIGSQLRDASLVAKYALNHNIANVTNAQLAALSKEIGIHDITLFQRRGDDIVGIKSSDPHEIGLSTKKMSGWFTAFQQLLSSKHEATINFGQSGTNYWTGPWANATSDPTKVDKWGYFDDGTTNYLIDPFVQSSYIIAYQNETGPTAVSKHIMESSPDLLGLTIFNPLAFGNKPIVWSNDGHSWVDFTNLPLEGTYSYPNTTQDVAMVRAAYKTDSTQSYVATIQNTRVLKTFVPIEVAKTSYVVGFVTNYDVIAKTLSTLLNHLLLISIILIFFIVLLSYVVSGYIVRPLERITEHVNQIANIRFDAHLPVDRNDEIGRLAKGVNLMSDSLSQYTRELAQTVRDERGLAVTYLGFIASGLIHELRNPATTVKNLVELMPEVYPLEGKGKELLGHIHLASEHLNSIITEFSDFIKQGKMSPTYVDVLEIAEEAVKHVQNRAATNHVNVLLDIEKASPGVPAYVDRNKIRQVLINLLSNAIDAVGEQSAERKVTLYVATSNRGIVMDVIDTGSGIPAKEWEEIFSPFHSSKENGFGLGLSLCRFFVLANGGKLRVKRSGKQGTVMRLSLPIAEVHQHNVEGVTSHATI